MDQHQLLAQLSKGAATWNQWRQQRGAFGLRGSQLAYPEGFPGGQIFLPPKLDLSSVALTDRSDLFQIDFSNVDLRRADLSGANLHSANFRGANLSGARLANADLRRAILTGASLEGANLEDSSLTSADLSHVNARGAILRGVNLVQATLVETDLRGADLTGSTVYGISAWNINLETARQADLTVTRPGEPPLTVDNLELAQFVYLLLTSPALRDMIDTLATRVVLILGRFTPERLALLRTLRDALRGHSYVPVLFDFEGPAVQNVLETVLTIARLARFIIADVTDAKAVDQELQGIVPFVRVPVRPLLQVGADTPGAVFRTLWQDYPDRMLKIHRYKDARDLVESLNEKVIEPAEEKARVLRLHEVEDIFE